MIRIEYFFNLKLESASIFPISPKAIYTLGNAKLIDYLEIPVSVTLSNCGRVA